MSNPLRHWAIKFGLFTPEYAFSAQLGVSATWLSPSGNRRGPFVLVAKGMVQFHPSTSRHVIRFAATTAKAGGEGTVLASMAGNPAAVWQPSSQQSFRASRPFRLTTIFRQPRRRRVNVAQSLDNDFRTLTFCLDGLPKEFAWTPKRAFNSGSKKKLFL